MECWDGEPNNRPDMNQVVARLKAMITITTIEYYPMDEQSQELDSDNTNVSSNNSNSSLLHTGDFLPTTSEQDANENSLDLSIVIDELVNLIFKETREGKKEKVRKQHIL